MSSAASALWASIVRTLVPLIAGGVITWLVGLGINLDPEFNGLFTTFLYAVFTGAYYIVVRLFETYVSPKIGWLLGLAKSPVTYSADAPKHAA
jgi:hypothetical protein